MSRIAIICVDDEEIILSSLGEQLKRSLGKDYDIELASSGQEALTLCKELNEEGVRIALVISDQMMPGMSGDEFLIKLHASYPRTLKILLTGQAGADSVGNVVNEAALYRFIAKPWNETDLILTVKEALRSYGQERNLIKKNILLKRTNQKLSKSLDLLLATLEAADDGILVLDNQGSVVIFNQQFVSLWQINPVSIEQNSNQMLGFITRRLAEPVSCNLTQESSEANTKKYNLLKLNNGKIFESYFQTQNLDGQLVGTVWGFRDVTAREKEKAACLHQSMYDTLTQLPKRRILALQLSEAIIKAKNNSDMLAVMFVDLERLKIINNTLGHHTGDLLLQQVIKRLQDCIRSQDIIARWGNDEFTLLLTQINSHQDTNKIAQRMLDVLKSPFRLGNNPLYVNIHIGIAVYPEHGLNADTLLKNADAAVAQAQQLKYNNYKYYNSSLSNQAHKLLTLENHLHSALKRNEFLLYYQPIVDIITGKIVKMEALLRWKNPQLGLVEPDVFIPLAEKNGEIIAIDEWVLKTACIQNKAWQEMGLPPITISVNSSPPQFQQQNLVATITNILEKTQLQPSFLELEITENIAINHQESAKTILQELHQMGIALSMDDFGTGYSSLGYLKQFPFHTLKIDRSFIQDLYSSPEDIAIVEAIITLGKGLNLNVVAEGVETEELKELLKHLGCKYIQGYLFSKPLPVEEATELLKNNLCSNLV